MGGPREVYVTRGLHDLRRVIPADVAFMRTSGPRQSSSRSPFFFFFFFKVLVMKPDLGIKTLPPHLSLTFTRTSTIDTPHCPPDPCRLDRRNHPALGALQVHLVLSHPGGIRTLFRSSRVFVRLKFVAIELSDSRIGRKPSHTARLEVSRHHRPRSHSRPRQSPLASRDVLVGPRVRHGRGLGRRARGAPPRHPQSGCRGSSEDPRAESLGLARGAPRGPRVVRVRAAPAVVRALRARVQPGDRGAPARPPGTALRARA